MKSHAICEVKSIEGDDPNGSFEAILSAPTLDRDGEVIDSRAFEPLPDRIPIDIDHGMTVSTTVGSGVPFYDGDVLKIKGSFSSIPRAQELRTLVKEGHIGKMSVVFMGAQRAQKDGVPHVEKGELLNAAFVPIPSNREAAVTVAKAFAPTEGEKAAAEAGAPLTAEMVRQIVKEALADHDAKAAQALRAGDHWDHVHWSMSKATPFPFTASGHVGWQEGIGSIHRETAEAMIKTPEAAAATAETDPDEAAAPAAAKSADVSAFIAAARAQAEAASVL